MKSNKTIFNLFVAALFLILCMVSHNALAQEKVFRLKVSPAEETEGMQVYISTQNIGDENKTYEAKLQGGEYVVTANPSNTQMYNLVVVKNNAQNIQPIYSRSSEKSAYIEVLYRNGRISVENTPDNKALSRYTEILIEKGIALWSGKKLNTEEQKEHIASYKAAADSLVGQHECSPTVKKYIEINGYTSAYSAYSSLPRALGIKRSEITFSVDDVLPEPCAAMDHEITALFPLGKHTLLTKVPKGTLSERLKYINTQYQDAKLKKMLATSLVESFVTNTKAAANYEAGLSELTTAVEQYDVDKKYLEEYAKLRNVIPGSSFPSGIVLEDINGNKVDFAKFKGKYVYIDLWASWCGPCVREIPHLQALETEFKDSNVVFVSISVDTSKDAWKKRVSGLKLHGNQFIDAEGKLSPALNIQGIPHFLIYDKEGKLHTYKALRPSSGEELKKILKNLY